MPEEGLTQGTPGQQDTGQVQLRNSGEQWSRLEQNCGISSLELPRAGYSVSPAPPSTRASSHPLGLQATPLWRASAAGRGPPGRGFSGPPFLSAATLIAGGAALACSGRRASGVGSGGGCLTVGPHRSPRPGPLWLPQKPYGRGARARIGLRETSRLESEGLSQADGAPHRGETPESWGLLVAHPSLGVAARNPTLPQAVSPSTGAELWPGPHRSTCSAFPRRRRLSPRGEPDKSKGHGYHSPLLSGGRFRTQPHPVLKVPSFHCLCCFTSHWRRPTPLAGWVPKWQGSECPGALP